MIPPAMSKNAPSKGGSLDPLLVIVATLLLLAVLATLYFAAQGPSKPLVSEPPVRPRPIIQDETRVVVVTKEVAGGAATESAVKAPEAKSGEAKPAEAKPAESKAAEVVTAAPPAVKASADGKIHGRVVLKGTPPPEKPIGAAKSDSFCGKSYPDAAPTTRNYVVGADGGLRYAVVRVLNAPAGSGTPAESPVIDQHGCMYEPYVVGVMAGQKFQVKNSDTFLHNVNSGKPKNNPGFNFSQAAGQVNEKSFDNGEMWVKMICNVHPWMAGYVCVAESAYFAVTNDKGEFTIPDGLPPGKYKLQVDHLKAGTVSVEVEIAAGKGAEVAVELAVK